MVPISLIVLLVWISKLILIKANSEVFNQCIRSPKPSVIRCIGQQTLSSLINLDKMDNFTIVSGLEMIRPDDGRQRSLTDFFVEDPMDFRFASATSEHSVIQKLRLQFQCSFIQRSAGKCWHNGWTAIIEMGFGHGRTGPCFACRSNG